MPSTGDDASASSAPPENDDTAVEEWDEEDGVEYADDEDAYAEDEADWDDEADWEAGEAPARRRAGFAGGFGLFRRRRSRPDDEVEYDEGGSAELEWAPEEQRDDWAADGAEDPADIDGDPEDPDPDWDADWEDPGLDQTGSSRTRGGARRAARTWPGRRTARRPRVRTVNAPQLPPAAAAAAVGLLTGLVGVALTLVMMAGCGVLLGTPSCGGGLGFIALVLVIAVTVLAGRAMMRFLSVPDAAAIAFVGVVTVVVLLLLLAPDSLFSVWMWIVVPLLTAVTFASTCALTMAAETSPDRR